ncbi:hypothetical protein SLS53_003074 [Cytospora paraplurivora]|uniref:NAD(P)-binding protein n=1 Tax=Cytospora paraplurivora TaxID=2898453 RepID=A0AAN9UJZ1_9PEZI
MPSYVVTGVSQGLGAELLRQLSSKPENLVIGLVRDKAGTEKKVASELPGRSNIHILRADITSRDDLKKAAQETAAITGGSLDYLIANAAYVTSFDSFDPIDVLLFDSAETKPKEFAEDFHKLLDVNVLGNVYLYNAFVPLILKGTTKKVVCITSGMADIELVRNYDIGAGALYAASKAAMNMVTAKYSAQYKDQGVLFIGICPGMVDVGKIKVEDLTPHQIGAFQNLLGSFQRYEPNFKGPVTPDVAMKTVIKVWENASLEKGDGGGFLSHTGTDRWL